MARRPPPRAAAITLGKQKAHTMGQREAHAIFFDLDDTLMDSHACWSAAVTATCSELADRYPAMPWAAIQTAYMQRAPQLWAAMEADAPRGFEEAPTTALRLEVWQRVLSECAVPALRHAGSVVESYERHRRQCYTRYPDVLATLQQLRESALLGVITNGPSHGQMEKLEVLELAPHFSVIVASGEVGIAKPDPRIFRCALERMGADASTAWHVGDSLAKDVLGARAAGLGAVWLNRRGLTSDEAIQPDYEIASLAALPAILGLE
jgi:putative hydrolase of the HAD superfamily